MLSIICQRLRHESERRYPVLYLQHGAGEERRVAGAGRGAPTSFSTISSPPSAAGP